MGFFSKLFSKSDNDLPPVVFVPKDQPTMLEAYEKARKTFKFFWRELYWEYRRIIPAHNFSCVKLAFQQKRKNSDSYIVEYMWIGEIIFDGSTIKGVLMNDPNELTNINAGAIIEAKVSEICDWMFSIGDRAYGGFSVQTIRSSMSTEERQAHDEAWGLNFGNPNDIEVVYEQTENPHHLIEHPMSIAAKNSIVDYFNQNPSAINELDEDGFSLLHREAIAGNTTIVELLLDLNARQDLRNPLGKTALDYAIQLEWEPIINLLQNPR